MIKASDATANLRPIFIKANIQIELNGTFYGFAETGVSAFGASNLTVQDFDPMIHVGESVPITLDVLGTNLFQIKASATTTAEATVNSLYLGLKFNLEESARAQLMATIRAEGFYPTSYVRKYPRIPASDKIPSMPVRCIVTTENDAFISFDIADMSPNGILLHTENPNAALMVPGLRISGQIEPRGPNTAHVDFIGMVCRMMLMRNPITNNLRRYIGVKLNYIPEDQRPCFLEILRSVVENIQRYV